MTTFHPPSRHASAFTLIELLSIVATLSLLAAVLLPSLLKLRDDAQKDQCLANQREIFKGVQAYATAENGWLLVTGYNSSNLKSDPPVMYQYNPTWSRTVAKMLDIPFSYEQSFGAIKAGDKTYEPSTAYDSEKMHHSFGEKNRNNGIMRCPSENFTNFWGGQNSTSYGWNTQSYGMGVSDYYGFSPPIGKTLSEALRRIKNTEIVNPATTFMIGEHIIANRMFDYVNSQFHLPAKDGDPGFATYHQGASNALWADGHASTITQADLLKDNFSRLK